MTEQLSILSVTFFVASIIALKGYAIMAGAARRIFLNSSKIRNRISGSLFFASAAGLAFAKKS